MLRLEVDTTGFDAAIKMLSLIPGKLEGALTRGLTLAKKEMQSAAVHETTDRYYVPAGKLRREMSVRSTKGALQLAVRGKRHSLASYKLSPKRPPAKNRPYTLRAAVKKSGGLKTLSSFNGNKPFLAQLGGYYVPMVRTGKGRLPLRRFMSPAYSQLVRWSEGQEHAIEQAGKEALMKALQEALRK